MNKPPSIASLTFRKLAMQLNVQMKKLLSGERHLLQQGHLKRIPPLIVTPPASIENTAAENEQQQKTKAPRKRRTQQEILLAQQSTYAAAISIFTRHGLEKATAKLKKAECTAVLTLGFDLKVPGKIAELRSRIDEEVAKGRSDKAFWKDFAEANSKEAVVRGEGGAEAEPRGRKRPREETNEREDP